MKKLLSFLFCGLLLFGCSKEYDDSEIKKRLDNLENTRIPSIESQIAAIQTSLPLLQQADTEIKGYITTLQSKVSALEQSMSDVDVKIKALEYTLQTDFSQRLADVVSQLNAYKQEIQNKIDSFNSSIESLQSADTELEKKISYLDGKIDMQKDWVTATFTTLTQYNGLVADIATIRTHIETINKSITDLETRLNEKIETDIATAVAGLQEEIGQKVTEITDAYTAAIGTAKNEITAAYTSAISSAIDNCIATMKDWVNEKLANYYNIAAIDAKVQLLQNAITDGDKKLDEKLRNEITTVNKSIETAKSELTAAYENAIKTAIETNNGIIDNKIAQEITTINNRIDTEVQTLVAHINDIETRLSSLENKVEDIDNSVTALLKRIQSIIYIPRYNDGNAFVNIEQGRTYAEFDFAISPKDAIKELAQVWETALSIKAIYTLTRTVSFVDLPITNFKEDIENGVITLKVSGENLSSDFFLNKESANVALYITDGNNSIISEFIPLVNNDNPFYTIHYTTVDNTTFLGGGSDATFDQNENFVSNIYENGQGTITYKNKITKIDADMFSGCYRLTSITIPYGVTSIGSYAFYNCQGLKNIVIPNRVTSIGRAAFGDCNNLTDVTIGENITSIDFNIFLRCDKLTNVYCNSKTLPAWQPAVLFDKANKPTIYVPNTSINDYKNDAQWQIFSIVGYIF